MVAQTRGFWRGGIPHNARMSLRTLSTLDLDNRYAQLPADYFSRVTPQPLAQPQLLHFNPDAAALIDLDPAQAALPEFAQIFSGNAPLPGGETIATVYAGHQFGQYVPQLGDGRAMLLGQARNTRGASWDLQLKGAGHTPYSRFGDGRAVLRSSIREYLCGEAMHGLGIPTTRALCLIASPEPVRRETVETAAVVCRMAPSHVRFGHFEYFYYQDRHALLQPLADQVIGQHYAHLQDFPGKYAAWLTEVIERTATLIAQWQTVGFCHGVMNTDNMSVLGLTLDYGPYGFLDGFDSRHICNHSDEGGRYAYDQQPMIGHWNSSKLLQATLPLLHADADAAVEIAEGILGRYPPMYTQTVVRRWADKLGLREVRDEDRELINRFLNILDRGRNDFTRSFRMLAEIRAADESAPRLRDHLTDTAAFDAWLADYRTRLRSEGGDDGERAARMNAVNPKYVLRNHLVQQVIERSQAGDHAEIDRLFRLLQKPFDEQPEMERYAAEPPPEARLIEVSCSS